MGAPLIDDGLIDGGLVRDGVASLALATMAALALGCAGDSSEPPPELGAAPWVEIGHGLESFEALEDEAPIEIVLGSQGGWHVDLAARFGAGTPEGGFAVYRVWDPGHAEQISYPIKASLQNVHAREDGSYEQAGVRTVFAIADPSEILGRTWLVEVELLVDGEVTVDERMVTLVDEEP